MRLLSVQQFLPKLAKEQNFNQSEPAFKYVPHKHMVQNKTCCRISQKILYTNIAAWYMSVIFIFHLFPTKDIHKNN